MPTNITKSTIPTMKTVNTKATHPTPTPKTVTQLITAIQKTDGKCVSFPVLDALFATVLQLTQYNLKDYLYAYLCRCGYTNIAYTDGYLYAAGTIPVMLEAHMDTVHTHAVESICMSDTNCVSSPEGVGGDDRCGIYTILRILRDTTYRPYILFTEDEEIGCVGANKFCSDLSHEIIAKPPLHFIVEIDRKGANDSVFYECDNPEFETFINQFGFVTAYGSYSDIAQTAPAIGVAAVNVSSAYYHPHTLDEYINLNELETVIKNVTSIVSTVQSGNSVPYQYIEMTYDSQYGSYGYQYSDSCVPKGYTLRYVEELFDDNIFIFNTATDEYVPSFNLYCCVDSSGKVYVIEEYADDNTTMACLDANLQVYDAQGKRYYGKFQKMSYAYIRVTKEDV